MDVFRGALLVYHLVSRLSDRYPSEQIGKVKVQTLMYLFECVAGEDFNYTLYHYGPRSGDVCDYINAAKVLGFIGIEWKNDRGYFITPLSEPKGTPVDIDSGTLGKIDEVVEAFGELSVGSLIIVSSALYMKTRLRVSKHEELVKAISSLKPKEPVELVSDLVKKATL